MLFPYIDFQRSEVTDSVQTSARALSAASAPLSLPFTLAEVETLVGRQAPLAARHLITEAQAELRAEWQRELDKERQQYLQQAQVSLLTIFFFMFFFFILFIVSCLVTMFIILIIHHRPPS